VDAPIIGPDIHPSIGVNIQGPTVVRVPDWVQNPLGRYYLYFADHKGLYIRLAYADALTGPWQIHAPGSLQIEDSYFLTGPPQVSAARLSELVAAREASGVKYSHDLVTELTTPHIASPDIHVDKSSSCTTTAWQMSVDSFPAWPPPPMASILPRRSKTLAELICARFAMMT
jgi:hypothetical protein